MEIPQIAAVVIMVLFVLAVLRARRRRGRILGDPGPGTAGAIYDMLNEDKRKRDRDHRRGEGRGYRS